MGGVIFLTTIALFTNNTAIHSDEHNEVVTMMGQIAATAIGALAGYFTVNSLHRTEMQEPDSQEEDLRD